MDKRFYETFFLIHPEKSDEERQDLIERLKKIVEDHGGSVFTVDPWPLRTLAYRVQKQTKGYYVLMEYEATGDTIQELTRIMRIDDRVMKFMTLKKEKDWTPPETESASEENSTASA